MKWIRNLGVVGGLGLATASYAQAPAVQRARDRAETAEDTAERRARSADSVEEGDGEGGGAGGRETRETTRAADRAADDEGSAAGGANGGEPAPEEYVVVPGDTLWDLCEKFMQNPFYWPKIWSINPHIENAHWIYPGNIIKFYAGGEGAEDGAGGGKKGSRAAGEEGGGDEGGEDGNTAGEDGADGEGGSGRGKGGDGEGGDEEFSAGSKTGDGADDQGGGGQDGFDSPAAVAGDTPRPQDLYDDKAFLDMKRKAQKNLGAFHLVHFVSKKEMERAGDLQLALVDENWLTRYQRVLLTTRSPAKKGDRFFIFRATRDIKHPSRPTPLGSLVEIVGLAEVEESEGGKSRAMIMEAYGPIERGDRITPYVEWAPNVKAKPNEREVTAVVADTYEEYTTQLGEHHLVFLDKGKGDGVQPGNTFDIIRRSDGMTGETYKAPDDVIGHILVLDTKDGVSTGIITSSRSEIMVGEKVEMRPAKKD